MSEFLGRVIKATYADRSESIGTSLRRIREGCGLTQSQLAKRLHTSQAAVSKLERRDDLQVTTVRKYVEALGARLKIDAAFPENSPMGLKLLDAFEVNLTDEDQLILPICREEAFRANHDVVLSIKPQYSEKIIEGQKTVELRRRFPVSAPKGTIAYIYSTSPTRAMIGIAEIDRVTKLPVDQLWKQYSREAVIKKEDFDKYFEGVKEGFALHFANVNSFTEPLSLEYLREYFGFEPPQSFLYAKHNFREALSGGDSIISH